MGKGGAVVFRRKTIFQCLTGIGNSWLGCYCWLLSVVVIGGCCCWWLHLALYGIMHVDAFLFFYFNIISPVFFWSVLVVFIFHSGSEPVHFHSCCLLFVYLGINCQNILVGWLGWLVGLVDWLAAFNTTIMYIFN